MSKPQPDELARRLQQSLSRRRPRPWKPVIAALVLGVIALGVLAWWLYPRGRPEVLQVVAFDAVFTTEETPRVRAQLLLPEDDDNRRRLRGQTLVFHEPFAKPGVKVREVTTESGVDGEASAEWSAAPPPAIWTEFGVRYIDVAHQKGSNDAGRICVWPKDSPLFVVDVDETLAMDPLDEQALTKLLEAEAAGWRIVYLAVASAQAHQYRGVRGKIWQQTRLPPGPVLGRSQYPSAQTAAEARREVLQALKARFVGKRSAVVKSAEAAAVSKELGFDTITIGAEAPGALHVASWADVIVRLK